MLPFINQDTKNLCNKILILLFVHSIINQQPLNNHLNSIIKTTFFSKNQAKQLHYLHQSDRNRLISPSRGEKVARERNRRGIPRDLPYARWSKRDEQ